MKTIRNDIDLITESMQINEAWLELPPDVRENISTVIKELDRLDEATLAPQQIQQVFQSIVANRGQGGNTQQIAKKVQTQLTPLFNKITSNPKLKAVLTKVGGAVPLQTMQKMIMKLPDPAGKNAQAILGAITKGAQTIQNDEDINAFKGLMLTVIGIGLGAAGVGGPALLGVLGTTALMRTVVDSAISAAAGGTVADVAKTAATSAVKGAAAGAIGNVLGDLLASEIQPPQVENGLARISASEIESSEIADAAGIEATDTSATDELSDFYPDNADEYRLQYAQQWAEQTADRGYPEISSVMIQKIADNLEITGDYPNNFTATMPETGIIRNGLLLTSSENEAWSQFIQDKDSTSILGSQGTEWLKQNVEGADQHFAQEAADAAARAEELAAEYNNMSAEEQQEYDAKGREFEREWGNNDYTPPGTPKYDITVADSFVHPAWKIVLSEEIGEDFDNLVEQLGDLGAVYVMLEWYNSYIKDNHPIIKGMENLQQHQLIENVQQLITEAPATAAAGQSSNLAQKIGGAYKKSAGVVGQAAKKAAGGVTNRLLKPVIASAPVKAFLNNVERAVGLQGPIDSKKLQADYAAAKSPTDSDQVSNFLVKNAGATRQEVQKAFDAAGVEAKAPAEKPEEPAQSGEQPAQQPAQQQQPAQSGEQPTQQPAQQQQPAQGGAQGTPAPKTGAQGTTGAARGDNSSTSQSEIAVGKKATVNKQTFTWNGNEWVNNTGQPATGLIKQELMKSQGMDISGKPVKPGIIQRTKDFVKGKTPGLAQATRSDPKASLLKKAGATAAAAVGGAVGAALSGRNKTAAAGEQPAQAQAAAGEQPAQAQAGKKEIPAVTKSEYSALQKRTMSGDAAAAKELVDRLSNANAKNYDIDNYANSIGAILKKSNIDPNLKSKLTTQARALRTEAYQHMNRVLEAAGLTWEDLGYAVAISESVEDTVLLIPTYEINLHEIKTLAGM